MLGKLIKFELKQTGLILFLMAIFLGITTVFGFIFGVIPYANSQFYNIGIRAISILAFLLYMIMILSIYIGSTIYLGVRFYNTMYSNKGYLTNSLPLSINELMIGKILSAAAFLSAVGALIYLSARLLWVGYRIYSGDMDMDDVGYFLTEFQANDYGELFIYIIANMISVLLNALTTSMLLFLSVSIGQLFDTNRLFLSVVIFVVISIAIFSFDSLIAIVTGIATMWATVLSDEWLPGLIFTLLRNLALIVGAYTISYAIIKDNLNLE